MKQIIRSSALVGSFCATLFALPHFGYSQNFYLNADAGIAFAEKVDLDQFLVSTPGAKLELDPGVHFGVAGGYNFNAYLGVQLSTGFIANNIDNLSSGDNVDAVLTHVPLMAEFVARYDKVDCKVMPYVGIGAGGDLSIIALDEVRAPNGALVDGSDTSLEFAWQVFAGARYKFNQPMSLGGGYRFFWADGASWDVHHSAGDIKTGRALVHSVTVDFNMKF